MQAVEEPTTDWANEPTQPLVLPDPDDPTGGPEPGRHRARAVRRAQQGLPARGRWRQRAGLPALAAAVMAVSVGLVVAQRTEDTARPTGVEDLTLPGALDTAMPENNLASGSPQRGTGSSPALPAGSTAPPPTASGASGRAGSESTSPLPAVPDAAPPVVRSTTPAPAPAPVAEPSTSDDPITGYSACATASAASFTVTFTDSFSWHHVFINVDGDTSTGYRISEVRGGFGADYMIENDTLYRSTGSSWQWTAVGGGSPLVSRSGGTYRWNVALERLGAPEEKLVVVFNGSGTSPDAYTSVLTVNAC